MKSKLLRKTFELLDYVASCDGPASLKEMGQGLKSSPATCSRIASDLVEAGLLRKSDYHSFEPALGLIHLGQRATLNYIFPNKVNKLIVSRCRLTGFKGALAGVYKDRLVYLYNSSHDEAPGRLGLPFIGHPFNSNIALVVLTASLGREKAMAVLKSSLRRHGKALPFKETLDSYSERMSMLETEGYSLLDGGAFWNVCMPLRWRSEILGLALYASPESALKKESLIHETQRLLSDIEEALLNSAR